MKLTKKIRKKVALIEQGVFWIGSFCFEVDAEEARRSTQKKRNFGPRRPPFCMVKVLGGFGHFWPMTSQNEVPANVNISLAPQSQAQSRFPEHLAAQRDTKIFRACAKKTVLMKKQLWWDGPKKAEKLCIFGRTEWKRHPVANAKNSKNKAPWSKIPNADPESKKKIPSLLAMVSKLSICGRSVGKSTFPTYASRKA